MKGLFITGPNRLQVLELLEPGLGPYDALVQMAACGICNSTDWKLIHGEFFSGTFPILLGHESVGTVIAVGKKVRHYRVGDMVLRPGLSDEQVPFEGGRSCWGGFAERAVVTDLWAEHGVEYDAGRDAGEAHGHPQQIVPPGIPAHEAIALITLKENLSSLENTGVGNGQSLAILGTGPVAQALTICAKLLGIHPIVVYGRQPKWEAHFLELGADAYVVGDKLPGSVTSVMDSSGFDRVIEAVGSRTALSTCLGLCAPGGKVNLYGIPPESEPYLPHEEADSRVFRSDVTEAEAHDRILRWVASGDIVLADWVSHVLPGRSSGMGSILSERKKLSRWRLRSEETARE